MLTSQEIARVDQYIEEVLLQKRTKEDLEKRITLLVDLLVHIHTECKTVEDDPDQWHFHKCSSVALMHIFMEKTWDRPFDDRFGRGPPNSGRDSDVRPYYTKRSDRSRL